MDTPPVLLDPPPPDLVATRVALHRLAAYVIAPVRYAATERFGLIATQGGFGTPAFDGRVIRVHNTELVDEQDGQMRTAPITSLRAAADFLGTEIDPETAAEHDTPAVGDVDTALEIGSHAARLLGEWFNVAFDALSIVRTDDESVDASPPQLWPGHFDPAIEMGDDAHRASYGASPGDDAIDEPYLYMSVWSPDQLDLDREDSRWNAPTFTGTVLRLSDFPADQPMHTAVEFWRRSRDQLERG